MASARIHIARWNPDTNHTEWDNYSTKDLDFLVYKEIIDLDTLGYAMRDQDAFNKALENVSAKVGGFSCSDLAEEYLNLTNKDIWIM